VRRRWPILAAVGATALALAVTLAGPAQGYVINGYFTDDNGNTFEGDIDAIAAAGITKGCNPPTNSRYCPSDPVHRGAMAAFLRRALDLPNTDTDFFVDDNGNTFENDINAIAQAGITRGCNPPTNNRYCPGDVVSRGVMAALLRRALDLPNTDNDYFIDDRGSIFENDINAIAEVGITKGCNPPADDRFCPSDTVSRGAMAAFLRRALGLPSVIHQMPISDRDVIACDKDGEQCSVTIDLSAGRSYLIEEGFFQVLPATSPEVNAFTSSATSFTLTLNGSAVSLTPQPITDNGSTSEKTWRRTLSFTSGNHTLVGQWRWDGALVQTTIVTVRAGD